ncbi:hypothetical protein [Flavobacterium inviolabile]|uniref:hypothetical protein n=1 Tax=Flavobacterium inviolabile TaxID=2748320 RepID=UPI0015B0749E|nr:hypothetical protein [Flavobacterium inviolabile]
MKNILILFIVFTFFCCKQKNEDFKFYECEFLFSEVAGNPFDSIDKYNKWVDNKQDAINLKVHFNDLELNKRNLNSLYKTKAQYFFIIGGGGIWVQAKNCRAEIKNDTLFIIYKPKWNREPVGEAASTMICMELDKTKYPNYRELTIDYIQE